MPLTNVLQCSIRFFKYILNLPCQTSAPSNVEIRPPWFQLFANICHRSCRVHDMMKAYGLRRACQWAGNSPAIAMKNYSLVRKTNFVDDGNSVTKSGAILDADANSYAESANMVERKPNKKRTAENQRSLQCVSVDDIGLEPTTSSMSTRRSSQLS